MQPAEIGWYRREIYSDTKDDRAHGTQSEAGDEEEKRSENRFLPSEGNEPLEESEIKRRPEFLHDRCANHQRSEHGHHAYYQHEVENHQDDKQQRRRAPAGRAVIVRPQQAENHRDRNDDHARRHHNHKATDECDQEWPETALEILAKMNEIEVRKCFLPHIVASPETGDQPTFEDDLPYNRNENA